MERISVSVEKDYLQRVASGRPLPAIAELIWNGLDEDADEVTVDFERTPLGALEFIKITDNGNGIPRQEAAAAFGHLGGSWKREVQRTRGRSRSLHGKAGKGRFLAFALGKHVEWSTSYREAGGAVHGYSIVGDTSDWGAFNVGDTMAAIEPGTEVTITQIDKSFESLTSPQAVQQLTEMFALYLHDYRDVKLFYDGKRIDPQEVQERYRSIELPPIEIDGRFRNATLIVIEWKMAVERGLHLCDAGGISLMRTAPNIIAKDFEFTAYLKSDYLADLHATNSLSLESLHPELRKFLDLARERLKEYFRARNLERASEVVEEWKRQDLYPYTGAPASPVEAAEREVFDLCALQLHDYAGFGAADPKSKRVSLFLLKSAIEQNPSTLKKLFSEVLRLPKERREDLAEMIELTSLSAIIKAFKNVTDRLALLDLLEALLFDPNLRRALRERTQLHKIVEQNTWLFGEEFHITGSDAGLTQVLLQHEHHMGRGGAKKKQRPVTTPEGKQGRVDIALGRKVHSHRTDQMEYLIIELKRPTVPLTMKVYQQIMSYGVAIAKDERFKHPEAKWTFWAVSNELDSYLDQIASKSSQQRGFLHADPTLNIFYWALPWREVIKRCRDRLKLFQGELQLSVTQPGVLDRLKKTYGKYLPAQTDSAIELLRAASE